MEYRKLKDNELVVLAANGDTKAVGELLLVRYRVKLVAAARNVNAKFNDDDIDDAIQGFVVRNITPDSKGNWRLRGISADNNPLAYVTRSFKNYLRDEFRKPTIDTVGQSPEEGRTVDDTEERPLPDDPEPIDEDYGDMHPKTQKELQISALFEALASVSELTPHDQYILATFLLGERYRGNGAKPLKIRERLSDQLNENPSTVYNHYSDLKALLSQRAAEFLKRLKD